jgi:cytidyltransferase-like protein
MDGSATIEGRSWRVGYVSGAFDLFHIGHLNLLRRARECCERLVVGVLSDEAIVRIKGLEPMVPLNDRLAIVAAIRYVDEADVTTVGLLDKVAAWHRYHFDAMFSGDDHAHDGWAREQEDLRALGAQLVFFPYTQGVSTTLFRQRLDASDASDACRQ